MKYIYPCLGEHDLGFIKLNGPGLANQMIVAARSYTYHKRYDIPMLSPTWAKFSIGPYLRHEKDKRHYTGLFRNYGITGIEKLWRLNHVTHSESEIEDFLEKESGVLKVSGLGRYFHDLNPDWTGDYFRSIVRPEIVKPLSNLDFENTVAVHVRLGDFPESVRIPIEWYAAIIQNINKINSSLSFLLFSDGDDEELSSLLTIPNVRRVFMGNALADMMAMSRCRLVVAAHSTFSAMGAFIGKRPLIFSECDFAPLYKNRDIPEHILHQNTTIPDDLLELLK